MTRCSVSSDSSRKRSARVSASSTVQPMTLRSVDVVSRATGVAGGHQTRRLRHRVGLGLEVGDDDVDLLARLTHLGVQLLVEPPLERVLALVERVLAVLHACFGGLQRLSLARREAM